MERSGARCRSKKNYNVKSENGKIIIDFPRQASGQAVISAIAISTKNVEAKPAKPSPKNILEVSMDGKYQLASWLNITDKQYVDSNISFTKLPSEVYGADYLRFSKENRAISGSFISKENAHVYVFSKAALPWFNGYEKTTDTLQNSEGIHFNVFKKEVKKGEKVSLGPQENGQMYAVAVVPTYSMEEQDDRPILKLEAENTATTGSGVKKAFFKKSDYIEFTENTQNSITFTVNPGVANIYLMRYRYMNMNDHPVKVRFKIEDANGILLRNDDIEFPVRQDKWKILNTTSGGFINAGTYKITLESNQMKGLRIESFEFQ